MTNYGNIPAAAFQKLGHYVYLYVHPSNGKIFYVGKGTGARAISHLEHADNDVVRSTISSIRKGGAEPRIEILAHSLRNADHALQLEAAAIEIIGLPRLSNKVRGHKSGEIGRQSIADLVAKFQRSKVNISEPSLLIRVSKLFRYGMSDIELYDITRGVWRIGEDRNKAELAFAVFEGIIQEVYSITQWFPGGSTFYSTRPEENTSSADRWEFVGNIASDEIRKKYKHKYVGHKFKRGYITPYKYENIKES